MNRFDFYKELYFKEDERKDSLNDALTLPIGVVTGQIGLLFYFYSTYMSNGLANIPCWVIVIFFCSVFFLLLGIFFLTYSYFEPALKKTKSFYKIESAFDYYYIDFAAKFEKFYIDSIAYNNETTQIEKPKSNQDLEDDIINNIVVCIDHNDSLNEKKTTRLWKSKLFLVIALILNFFLLIYPFFTHSKETSIQKIEIIQPIKVNIMSKDDKAKPKEEPVVKPVEKPEPTKIRIIPEGKEVPKGNGKKLNG